MLIEIVVALMSLAGLGLAYIYHKQSTYWQKQGVMSPPGKFPFGNSFMLNYDILFQRKNTVEVAREVYKATKGEKFHGAFIFHGPHVVINDPDLAKLVLIKEFSHFVDRVSDKARKIMFGQTKQDQIWNKMMVNAEKEEWRKTRNIFTPIFTTGKLKAMVEFIKITNANLLESIEEDCKNGVEIELKDKFGRFTMDTLASCAFGVNTQSFTDPESRFVINAKNTFKRSGADMLRMMPKIIFPPLKYIYNWFKIPLFKPMETLFFHDVILQTMKDRQSSGIRRNDMVDMMLDALKGNLTQEEAGAETAKISDDDMLTIISTAMIIMIAGYDTTGMALSYLGYELAMNEEIQRRLQDEVDAALDETDGHWPDYNVINSLEYLDMCLHETLRRYPPVSGLQRACAKDFTLPDSNFTFKAGMELFVNVAGIQSDPDIYPDPEKFDPQRFSPEIKSERNPYAFLAFGAGPRNCIGMRFALLEAKMAMFSVMAKYNFVKTPNTVSKVTLDPLAALGSAKDPLLVKVEPRRGARAVHF